MSDRDMTRTRFGGDGMYADQLNEYAEEVARLRAQVGRLQSAVKHHAEHVAHAMGRTQGLDARQVHELEHGLVHGAGLHDGDLDPLEKQKDDGYTGPRVYVDGSEIRPFRDIVEDDDA